MGRWSRRHIFPVNGLVLTSAHPFARYSIPSFILRWMRLRPRWAKPIMGRAKGLEHFVYVTVSTGIGAGMILGGRYYTGGLGWAGGVGHTIIDETSPRICHGCGNAGCLETFAATQGIITTAQELLHENPDSLMLPLAGGDPAAITPEIVFRAAQQRDPTAQRVWQVCRACAGHRVDEPGQHRLPNTHRGRRWHFASG